MPAAASPQANAGPGQHALIYAGMGWRVLPIKPGEKRPPMSSWQHAASTDHKVIVNWFKGLYQNHGCGIATGEESGLWVLDIDVGEGKAGVESLAELEQRHGPLPTTVEAVTGSGGRHLYFTWPPGRRVVTRRDTGATDSPLPAGIDVRGEGGQVLAPPTVHPNGSVYRWRDGCAPWDREIVDAPEWLLAIVCEQEAPPAPAPATAPQGASDGFLSVHDGPDDSIAGWWNQTKFWDELLLADGWTPLRPMGSQQYWVRPGKEARDGHSATLHLPDGPFVIFSTDGSLSKFALPEARVATGDGWAFSKFGYTAASRHGGDRSEAARRIREVRTEHERRGIELGMASDTEVEEDNILVDWEAFWAKDHSAEEWIAYPVVPAHRQVALYAPGGTGKSLLALAIAASIATGRPCLGQPAGPPRDVLYFDYEMTEADLMERLTDLGYDHADDWSRLHYALLPAIDPLDTREGAKRVCALAEKVGAELVVIDTMARAVEGEENVADTYRNFYQWTGKGLKAAGRAMLRLDHAGKEADKGQRGSSAKNDDVDVVWQMALAEDGYVLTARKARMGWVPKTVNITKQDGPPLEFTTGIAFMWPAGTKELAGLLDELGLADDASTRVAQDALKASGQSKRRTLVVAAVRYRALRNDPFRTREPLAEPPSSGFHGNQYRNQNGEKAPEQARNHSGTAGNHPGSACGNQGGFLKEEPPVPSTGSEPEDDGWEAPF